MTSTANAKGAVGRERTSFRPNGRKLLEALFEPSKSVDIIELGDEWLVHVAENGRHDIANFRAQSDAEDYAERHKQRLRLEAYRKI
jgi:hypothetical protein